MTTQDESDRYSRRPVGDTLERRFLYNDDRIVIVLRGSNSGLDHLNGPYARISGSNLAVWIR